MLDQHIRFADKYFETLNGAESARYAGYAEDTAKAEAWRLLEREDIQAYLQELRAEYQEKSGISKMRVLDEYRKIAFSDVRNILTVDGAMKDVFDFDDDTAAAIASIKSFDETSRDGEKLGVNREIKLHDKLRALEALSKHLGLFEADNKKTIIIEQPFFGDEDK
jgi:phage terminase small subunit